MKFSWGGNPGVGSLHRFRDAVENQWPRPLEIEEHSHAAMANAYEAGAANLPFAMLRGYIGADLTKVNPNIKSGNMPLHRRSAGGRSCHPPGRDDHPCARADRKGNVLLEGIVGVQKEAVLGAKRSIVTVEEIVDELNPPSPNSVVLPSWAVTAVVEVPGGAFPSYAQGYYPRSNAFYIAWDEIARDRDTFQAWIEENILKAGPEDFARHAKKAA
jgi:glutaconate CoA-transferase subunit A